MKKGILVLGHGSKAPEADIILQKITEMVKQKVQADHIEMASLQFSRPSLEEGVDNMVERGIQHILIVPMFIFQGNHVKEDIPEAIARMKEKHMDIEISLAQPMGADERLAEILTDRIKEAEEKV